MRRRQYHYKPNTKYNVDRNSYRFDSECWAIFGLDLYVFGLALFWRFHSEYYAHFRLSFNALDRVFLLIKPVASYTEIRQHNQNYIVYFAHHFGVRTVRELICPRAFNVGLVHYSLSCVISSVRNFGHIIKLFDRRGLLRDFHVELPRIHFRSGHIFIDRTNIFFV